MNPEVEDRAAELLGKERVAEFEVGVGEKEWSESDWWEKQLGRPLSAKK